MFPRGIAVVAITRRGVETALNIGQTLEREGLKNSIFSPKKYIQDGVCELEGKVGEFIKNNYSQVDAIVAVMATGIIIRAVAPYIQSKLSDPAIIVVDATGKHVISLLSGHYGGANELTKIIAKGIGATPVVTTASDSMGKQSVDELAKLLHLTIENPKSLAPVNAAIVNGEKVVLVLVGDVKIPLNVIDSFYVKHVGTKEEAVKIVKSYDAGVIVTKDLIELEDLGKPCTLLKVRNIVVGLGCRKNSHSDHLVETVNAALEIVGLSAERINMFASVDIKRDSAAMIDTAKLFNVPLEFLSVEALRSLSHPDLSPDSELVREKIGVGGVCERVALIMAGKNSSLILKKIKLNGTTVAIAEGK
ncbi:MAG: cobalt-precorrin 5A hydrolase [Candidatus Bathyarchaeota archaeon]|uniref:cobalt-precorrin 5A hydrolase n=1 Tax=Candidatus Bathycorpusculum sp. TaxID=2994959 RepID=UPI002824709B|nr:cobalt-precorrin 5A hydrolase [Candidatus Termiticorpusculum sp.]MCL2257016.1 cobalt-precorrin 5A hydrolase [Candidatus Termiticorpusculum sp.]MCL2292859.1 cobalt-precorrin 5A hydrolase [Candidatus Termiticorpusculum sp.]